MAISKKPYKNILVIMIITIFSKMLGFARTIVMSNNFGISIESDAYFMAELIPTILFGSIYASIATTFIPSYSHLIEEKGKCEADKFASNLINIIVIISIILCGVGIVFSEKIVSVFAPGFNYETIILAADMLKILFPTIIIIAMTNIVTGILQVNESFIAPSIIGFPFNLIIILGVIFLKNSLGIYSLVFSMIIALIVQLLIQLIPLKKKFEYTLVLKLNDDNIKNIFRLVIPVLIGTAITQINTMVDKMMASTLPLGTVSAINYSNRVISLFNSIFIMSIITIIYPYMSKYMAKDNAKYILSIARKSIEVIISVSIPITVLIVIFREQVVTLLFERGSFDSESTKMTAYILGFYAINITFSGVRLILSNVFYSMKNTKAVMKNGSIAVIINIILNIILVKIVGVCGLAISTSISAIVSCFLLNKELKKVLFNFENIIRIKEIYKIILASIVMLIFINIFDHYLGFIVNSLIAIVIYIISVKVLKVDCVNWILGLFKIKLLRKRGANRNEL